MTEYPYPEIKLDDADGDVSITLPGIHVARLTRVAATYTVGDAYRLGGWGAESPQILAAMEALHNALMLADLDFS
jgi:hypothetical protein